MIINVLIQYKSYSTSFIMTQPIFIQKLIKIDMDGSNIQIKDGYRLYCQIYFK